MNKMASFTVPTRFRLYKVRAVNKNANITRYLSGRTQSNVQYENRFSSYYYNYFKNFPSMNPIFFLFGKKLIIECMNNSILLRVSTYDHMLISTLTCKD